MLVEKVNYFIENDEFDYNCAETIIYAANEVYDLNLSKEALQMLAPFGGGLFMESVCGIVTASLATLGALFTNNVSHESQKLKDIVNDYYERFDLEYGTFNCAELKADYRSEDAGCSEIIIEGAIILEAIIDEYLEE